MKKIFVLIIICFMFLFGLTIGGSFNKGASQLFEETKEEFENEIVVPDNNYQAMQLVPNDNIVNKAAKKFEKIIDKVIDKIFSFLS
ncbi:MAG: hypothetical protein J6K18_02780 [Bacilli bacterium]|nr:hypothetical protein [Bacilli bacterium]